MIAFPAVNSWSRQFYEIGVQDYALIAVCVLYVSVVMCVRVCLGVYISKKKQKEAR